MATLGPTGEVKGGMATSFSVEDQQGRVSELGPGEIGPGELGPGAAWT